MRVVRPRGCCLVGRLVRVSCFSVVLLAGRLRLAGGLLGLFRCGLCWAARLGACAGVLLVGFCLLRLWGRWLCRWCWRWLPALGGRCLVSLLGLGRCPRCRSVVVWLAGFLLGLWVSLAVGGAWRRCVFLLARGLWSLACGACGCGCLCWPSFGLLSRLLLASSVGGLRACSLVLVSWSWLFCAVCGGSAWGCGCAFCFSLRFGFVAPGTGLRGGLCGR